MWYSLLQTKNQQGRKFNGICWVHSCIFEEGRIRRVNDEKGGEQAEKARPAVENEK